MHEDVVVCVFVCRQILVPYLAATGTATVTALGLNQVVAKVRWLLR